MATKRGICPYCKNEYIHNSIFLVNPEAVNCFCGSNMHQITPKEAIDAYNNYITNAVKKADEILEITCNPAAAYDAYAEVIDIDDSIIHAYLGRILCLIYMSKTRKSYLDEAKTLLETDSEKPFFLHLVNAPIVFEYFRRMVRVIEEYLFAVKKVLTFKKYFYDLDCLSLYLRHVYDAYNLQKCIFDLACEIQKKDPDNHGYDAFLKFLENKIREKERAINDYDYVTTDGVTHKFVKINYNHDAETVVLSKPLVDTKSSRYRMASLDKDNKKLRYIKDEIFKDYTDIIKARKVSIVFVIICTFVAVICGLGVYLFQDNFLFSILSIVGCAVTAIIAVILLVLVISWGSTINKKRKKMSAD